MAEFDLAIETILRHEGGFVNDTEDPGGATNFGISLRFLLKQIELPGEIQLETVDLNQNGIIDAEDIQNMDEATARKIYYVCWWQKFKYSQILDQEVATKVFDLAVHMGPGMATILMQQAINKIIEKKCKMVSEDGICGPQTRGVLNILMPSLFLKTYRNLVGDFYRKLCSKNHDLNKYLDGWLNRLED